MKSQDEQMDLEQLRSSTRATVTRKETSEVLGMDPRTVTQGIKEGTIPAIRVGRRVVIPREPLLAMLTAPVAKRLDESAAISWLPESRVRPVHAERAP